MCYKKVEIVIGSIMLKNLLEYNVTFIILVMNIGSLPLRYEYIDLKLNIHYTVSCHSE